MYPSEGKYVRLDRARDQLRQHFAIDAGLEPMDARPLESDPRDIDHANRANCQETMDRLRENAHENLAGLISSSKVTVWREGEDGQMLVAAPGWACDCFDGKDGLKADRLYFQSEDWSAWLSELVSASSREYLAARRMRQPDRPDSEAILWRDLGPPELERAVALARVAEEEEWWNWPESIAWVGGRELEHIATMRLCAEQWRKRGDYQSDVALGAERYLAQAYCAAAPMAEDDLQRAIERGAIRTLGRKSIDGPSHKLRPLDWRGGTIIYNRTATLASAANLLNEWACDVAVNRPDLWRAFPTAKSPQADAKGGKVPANRQLNHEKIIERAEEMRAEQTGISLGSAAASIRAELPPNPKTRKPRDQRGIEKIIAHLWEGKVR